MSDAASPLRTAAVARTAASRTRSALRRRDPAEVAVLLVFLVVLTYGAVASPQLLVVGIVIGGIYAVGAMALSLTYGVLGFPNIAQGLIMMLGAYLSFFFYTGKVRRSAQVSGDAVMPFNLGSLPDAVKPLLGLSFGYGLLLATAAATAVVTACLLLMDRLVYRPPRRRKRDTPLMLTILSFGVTYILLGILAMVWGTLPRNITAGIQPAIEIYRDVRIKPDQIFILAGVVVTVAVTYWLLRFTRSGKAIRAVMDNPELARASGIGIDRIIALTWTIVAALTTVGGLFLGLQAQLNPQLGMTLILPLFAAAALGGIGSPLGAAAGGLAVGILQELAVGFVPSGYKMSIAFVILVLVLLIRPMGFGQQRRREA